MDEIKTTEELDKPATQTDTDFARRRALLKVAAAAPVVATLYSHAAIAQTSGNCVTKAQRVLEQSIEDTASPDNAIRKAVYCWTPKHGSALTTDYWDDDLDGGDWSGTAGSNPTLWSSNGTPFTAASLIAEAGGVPGNNTLSEYADRSTCWVLVYHDNALNQLGPYPGFQSSDGIALTTSCESSFAAGNFTL